MQSDEAIKRAFKLACQYLQYNPPAQFATIEFDELQACVGAATYERGWTQWSNYFINKVVSGTDSDLIDALRRGNEIQSNR